MTQVEVLNTMDYDRFKLLRFNRKIEIAKVNTLVEAILESDMTALQPIMVNHEMYIVDGQHRWAACKELGIPVHYTLTDLTPSQVALLNKNQSAWNTAAWIHYHAELGDSNFQRLQADIAKYKNKYSYGTVGVVTNHQYRPQHLVEGGIIYTVEDSKLLAKITQELVIFSGVGHWVGTSRFVIGYARLRRLEGFDYNRVVKQVELYPYELKVQKDAIGYVENLVHFYNFKYPITNRIAIPREGVN